MVRGIGRGPRTFVLVSGSGTNLQAILDQVRAGRLPVQLVGAISDRPDIRALARAAGAGLHARTVDFAAYPDRAQFDSGMAAELDALDPQIIVLAGFMRILSPELVTYYAGRMLNVHPSLLPHYPGLQTYRRVLEAGDTHHGSTVHFVIPALDAGPGIIQFRVRIRPGEHEDSLRDRVQQGEYLIYPRAIRWLAEGRTELRDGAAWLDGERLAEPVLVEDD